MISKVVLSSQKVPAEILICNSSQVEFIRTQTLRWRSTHRQFGSVCGNDTCERVRDAKVKLNCSEVAMEATADSCRDLQSWDDSSKLTRIKTKGLHQPVNGYGNPQRGGVMGMAKRQFLEDSVMSSQQPTLSNSGNEMPDPEGECGWCHSIHYTIVTTILPVSGR